MKKKNILIMVLAIMLFAYIAFKVTLLFITNKRVRTTIYNYQVKDSIVLEYSEPKVKLTFKNITMRDDFERFNNFETENGTIYTLKKDDYKATFFITIEDDFVSNSNKTLSEFYKKYKINNTLDLINYLYKVKEGKNTLLTPVYEIISKEKLFNMSETYLHSCNNMIEVNNNAYICNLNSDIYEYKVFKEGKIYTFNFSSVDYYNMEYLRDFIKTIKIY